MITILILNNNVVSFDTFHSLNITRMSSLFNFILLLLVIEKNKR